MNQFTPQVSEQDVEWVLRRDFPVERQQELREMIQDIQIIKKHRVLACMRNAGGDVQKLKGNLNRAPIRCFESTNLPSRKRRT
jgi:hypothetical protein